jgi:hypothetical protein
MSSNAFYQNLEFTFPDPAGNIYRLFGFRLRRLVARADGEWFVETDRIEGSLAELQAGWVAAGGRLVGLRWRIRDGGGKGERVDCGLCCAQPELPDWRRLLVRLRVPMRAPLS